MKNEKMKPDKDFLKIPNEILDALCHFRIPGEVRQIVDVIIRKTCGWNKDEDWVAQSQIVLLTGILKGNVSRGLSKAITHRVVIKNSNKLRLNKNFKDWIKFGKLSEVIADKKLSEMISSVIKSDINVIKSEGNKIHLTKDTITKNIIPKGITKKVFTNPDIDQIIPFFKEINPSYKRFYTSKIQRGCLVRLIEQFDKELIIDLLKKLPEIMKNTYAPIITTPYEFETKFGKLKIFLDRQKGKNTKKGVTQIL